MENYSTPQKLPGTMTQTIPIQSDKKVRLPFIIFWWSLVAHFLSGQAAQVDQISHRIRPLRSTAGARLAEAIAAEKLDEFGSSCRRFITPRDPKTPAKRKRPPTDVLCADTVDTDVDDGTFVIAVTEGESDSSSNSGVEIGNEEVCTVLLSPLI